MIDNLLYEPHVIVDPLRPYVYHIGNRGTMPHWHENVEILYFHGPGDVRCDRTEYKVSEGDITIFGSNMIHSVTGDRETRYDCLIIDSKFLLDNGIAVSDLKFVGLVHEEKTSKLYREVMREAMARDTVGDEYSSAAVKAAILALMVYTCRRWARPSTGERSHGDTVRRALSFIKAHIDEQLTVDRIAEHAQVSKYYFCREFHRETGLTVVRYINNLRCREAERLLHRTDYTISEIARMCGFENLSYFTRTYKTVTGYTPTESRSFGDRPVHETVSSIKVVKTLEDMNAPDYNGYCY